MERKSVCTLSTTMAQRALIWIKKDSKKKKVAVNCFSIHLLVGTACLYHP